MNFAKGEVRDQSVCTQNSVSRLQDAPYEFYLFIYALFNYAII
jgi:hypothetical protein